MSFTLHLSSVIFVLLKTCKFLSNYVLQWNLIIMNNKISRHTLIQLATVRVKFLLI